MLATYSSWLATAEPAGVPAHPAYIYTFSIMAKILVGGVSGMARGSAGNYTFSVTPGYAAASGKPTQVVREKVGEVANPKTTAQALQRMKLGPASRFYNALEEILSNAYERVDYGLASRRYFMQKAMKQDGPYIPASVDRFIPAEYLVSEGSLPSFDLADRASMISGEGLRLLQSVFSTNSGSISLENFCAAVGVDANTQISFIIVTNDNGIFTPHYLGFNERVLISDLTFGAGEQYQVQVGFNGCYAFGLNNFESLPTDNIVAAAVILSVQDASGKWLRSTQRLQLNDIMYAQLYGADAMAAAIASYGPDASAANSVGSQWYLNLGINQPFNGRITSSRVTVTRADGANGPEDLAVGILSDNSYVIFGVYNGSTLTALIGVDRNLEYRVRTDLNASTLRVSALPPIVAWKDSYAVQAGWTLAE